MKKSKFILLIRSYRVNKRTEENSTHPNLADETIRNIYLLKYNEGSYKLKLINILTLGFLSLICFFEPKIFIYLYLKPSLPLDCEFVEVIDKEGNTNLLEVVKERFNDKNDKVLNITDEKSIIKETSTNHYIQEAINEKIVFYYKQNKYHYDTDLDLFIPSVFDLSKFQNKDIHRFFSKGIPNIGTYNYLLNKFGLNVIEMKEKNFFLIFLEQVLNINYIYQFLMIGIWYKYEYYYFPSIVISISLITILVNSINTSVSYKKILQFAHNDFARIIRNFDLLKFLKKITLKKISDSSKVDNEEYLTPNEINDKTDRNNISDFKEKKSDLEKEKEKNSIINNFISNHLEKAQAYYDDENSQNRSKSINKGNSDINSLNISNNNLKINKNAKSFKFDKVEDEKQRRETLNMRAAKEIAKFNIKHDSCSFYIKKKSDNIQEDTNDLGQLEKKPSENIIKREKSRKKGIVAEVNNKVNVSLFSDENDSFNSKTKKSNQNLSEDKTNESILSSEFNEDKIEEKNLKMYQVVENEDDEYQNEFFKEEEKEDLVINDKDKIQGEDKISDLIVPGDIIELVNNEILSCDCVLLDGFCTVNEADLTGESSLVMKTGLPRDDKNFSYYLNKKSFLFHGTEIIKCQSSQNEGKIRALVINTGFNTNRGNLIQNILFPRKSNSKFHKDTLFYLTFMIITYLFSVIFLILVYNSIKKYRPPEILSIKNLENYLIHGIDWREQVDLLENSELIDSMIKLILFNLVIIMPPTLAICKTFTSFFFQQNLKKKDITCVEDSKMTVAGIVNTVVLDKTGTLTEEDLELSGFQTTIVNSDENNESLSDDSYNNDDNDSSNLSKVKVQQSSIITKTNIENIQNDEENSEEKVKLEFDKIESSSNLYNTVLKDFYKRVIRFEKNSESFIQNDYRKNYRYNMIYFLECLATCHSIDLLKGNYFGNSVDKKIFENLDWIQVKSKENLILGDVVQYDMYPKNSYKITEENFFKDASNCINEGKRRYKLKVVKRFEFSSKYQSMSVIVQNNLDEKLRYFIKGAPERIVTHCNVNSLPEGFTKMLQEHTKAGFRVLAAATKPLDESLEYYGKMDKDEDRHKFETNLTFLGLIIFRNKLKKDTKHIIQKLNLSDCRLIMATGDNPFTSISVSKECELVKEDDKIYLLDLQKTETGEVIKLQHITQGAEDKTESNDESFTDRTNLKLLSKKRSGRLEPTVQELLSKLMLEENAILCVSGKCFEFIANKFIEEKETDDNGKSILNFDSSKLNDNEKKSNNNNADFRKSLRRMSLFKNDSYKQILDALFMKGKIFFRMSPNNKVLLVDLLKKNESNIVCMCGDGANDCGALLAADIGISLCNKVGNNVTSHFYSKDGSISCIEMIIRNGRACYENTTIIFKYMIISSLIFVTGNIILFYIQDNLMNKHFLFFDFFISIISCLLSSKTGPGYSVENSRIPLSIINMKFVIMIFGHIIIQVVCQFIVVFVIYLDYFKEFVEKQRDSNTFLENGISSYLFCFNCFQYIWMLFIMNMSSVHRKKFYANKSYVFYTSLLIFFLTLLISSYEAQLNFSFGLVNFVTTKPKIRDLNEIKKLIVLICIVVNIILSTSFEFIANSIIEMSKLSSK